MTREQRWRQKVEMPNGDVKVLMCGTETRDKNRVWLHENGGREVSCQKLYPFNAERHQHDFDYIHSICYNRIHDMIHGEVPYDEAEIRRLEAQKEKAEELFCMGGGIIWLTGRQLNNAKELTAVAAMNRDMANAERRSR